MGRFHVIGFQFLQACNARCLSCVPDLTATILEGLAAGAML